MTYGPDITAALEPYADEFDNLRVEERDTIISLNAIQTLSDLREQWSQVENTPSEHRLFVNASADETAELETKERGQYQAGNQSQIGMGIRCTQLPQNNEEIRWGYFEVDANKDPLNGFYFGVDAQGIFVAEVNNGTVKQKVYQNNWNVDQMDGTGHANTNPSGEQIDLQKGNIFQIEFVYYGYGPVQMELIIESGKYVVHRFDHDGDTSIENTNLPIRQQIDTNGTNNDALELYVGGRQYSIIGTWKENQRHSAHYRETLSGVDDTQWYPAISVKVKDGTDVGTIDFSQVLSSVKTFVVSNGNAVMRWQVRRNTQLNQSTWKTPSSHETVPDETALAVDTTATSADDANGVTGIFVDGGVLESGSRQTGRVRDEFANSKITDEEVVTLFFQAAPTESGSVDDIEIKLLERW